MPTYDYTCQCCGKMEVSQKISEEALKNCPQCGSETLKRGPGGGIGLAFKGTGFYITDYANKAPPEIAPSECCPCGKNKNSCSS